MYFLPTIEEDDESETLLQRSEGGGQKESDEPSSHGIRKSRQETDSESYEATMTHSEVEPVSQAKHGDGNPYTRSAPVASEETGKPHDELNKRASFSTPGSSERRSSSAANRRSLERTSLAKSRSPQRRTTSALGSPFLNAVSRSRSAGGLSGPVVRKSDPQKTTSLKRTRGRKASSTTTRRKTQRSQRTQSAAQRDKLPTPQWVINLMFDIEEATKHKLTVEYK